jgi:hypothetical protein
MDAFRVGILIVLSKKSEAQHYTPGVIEQTDKNLI